MIDPTQILLFAVIIVLTIMMVVIGWQIFQILSEIRKIFMKMNLMTDQAVSLTGNLGKSIQNLSGFSEGMKAVFGVFRIFKKKKNDDGDDDE